MSEQYEIERLKKRVEELERRQVPLNVVSNKWDHQYQRPCLFDQIPVEDRGKPMWISCPCPKCTPRC